MAVAWTVGLSGCAGSRQLTNPPLSVESTTTQLQRVLDRWVGWRSLSARVKLTVVVGDTALTARGHLIYLMGERYQLGFARPFDRFLGTFYVTPEQVLYWDLSLGPRVFGAEDTMTLGDLIPLPLPEWNPRDVLPFPVSGRSTGFQVDSILSNEERTTVCGKSGEGSHIMELEPRSGRPLRETVLRPDHASALKRFDRIRYYYGWPVAHRVTCQDSSGRVRLIWRLSDVRLEASPFELQPDSSVSAARRNGIEP